MNQAIIEAKKAYVAEIAEKMKNSESTVVVEYRGLTVAEMTDGMTVTETTDGMTVMAVAATITIMIPTIIFEITMTFRSRAAISLCERFRQ